jgi:FMN reductase
MVGANKKKNNMKYITKLILTMAIPFLLIAAKVKTEGAHIAKTSSSKSKTLSTRRSSSPESPNSLSTLIISTSLREDSKSRRLAKKIKEKFDSMSIQCEFIDLQDYPNLPHCDGKACFANETVQKLSEKIKKASVIILAFPIYNYDCSSATKNLIEVTGYSWKGKVVGLMCSAGSPKAFLSPLNLANSLMVDSNCVIIPKYVFANPSDFSEETEVSFELNKRLETLAQASIKLATAIQIVNTLSVASQDTNDCINESGRACDSQVTSNLSYHNFPLR